ncbi:MAG: hypothetical protein RL472_2164 [Pseudomonadota bacterium]
MTQTAIPHPLTIPETLAAGPGPGNTDARVLAAFANAGLADHMQADVLRGMIECKLMLREIFGTKNIYTFGVAGTGWSGLDCLFSAIGPGDTVVAFVNGTFSGIDALTVRMKASSRADLAANPMDPQPANVTVITVPHGQSVSGEVVEAALATHKPTWAVMAHWETGSGRINDLRGFSDACERHGVMGLVDAVSSLGIEDFAIDDFPGVAGWASCPQKGVLCLPLTYAPVSFTDRYIVKPGIGPSSTERMQRRAAITAPIPAMRLRPSTRLCGSTCSMVVPKRPGTMPSMKRHCAMRSPHWAAPLPRT